MSRKTKRIKDKTKRIRKRDKTKNKRKYHKRKYHKRKQKSKHLKAGMNCCGRPTSGSRPSRNSSKMKYPASDSVCVELCIEVMKKAKDARAFQGDMSGFNEWGDRDIENYCNERRFFEERWGSDCKNFLNILAYKMIKEGILDEDLKNRINKVIEQ